MTRRIGASAARGRVRHFCADEGGASLVEFALVVTLFLFLLLGIIDFGRIGHMWVGANKATQLAARLAAVRPPACPGVPQFNVRGTALSPPAFGALCRAGSDICLPAPVVACQGVATNATALEIYTAIRPLAPTTTIDQMRYTYAFDPNLGFLGGPYVPMVTVELGDPPLRRGDPTVPLTFPFISPLWPFVTALTGQSSDLGRVGLKLPVMSVSLPGEDLNLGTGG